MASIRAIAVILLLAAPEALASPRWRPISASGAPAPRVGAGLAYRGGTTAPGMVVFGGCRKANCDFGDAPSELETTSYRLEGLSWVAMSTPEPPARWSFAMAPLASGHVLLHGGWGGAQPFWLNDTWQLEPGGWTSRTGTGPSSRAMHAMALDSDSGNVVLFGGSANNSPSAELWIWNGSTWREAISEGARKPAGRYLHAMAYDAFRKEFVVYGGANLPADERFWTFKCDYQRSSCSWTWRDLAGQGARVPVAVEGASLVYLPRYESTWLFGGRGGSGGSPQYSNALWRWNGSSLDEVQAGSAPAGRWRAAMAFDPANARAVLVGGAGPSPLGDTWELVDEAEAIDGGCCEGGTPDGSTGTFDGGWGEDAGAFDGGTIDRADAGGEGPRDDDEREEPEFVGYSRYGCTTTPAGALLLVALLVRSRRRY